MALSNTLSIQVSDTVRIGREAVRPLEPAYQESPYFEVAMVRTVTWTPMLARAPSSFIRETNSQAA